MFKFIRKRFLLVVVVAVFAVILGLLFLGSGENGKKVETVQASRGNLLQEVSITGKIESSNGVELAFERSGRISVVNARAGEKVTAGQILVELYNNDMRAQLAQTQAVEAAARSQIAGAAASLQREQARLDDLKQGTSNEEIAVTQIQFDNANRSQQDASSNLTMARNKAAIDLNNLYGDVIDTVNDAYAKSDDAIRRYVADFFTTNSSWTSNYQLTFGVDDNALETSLENQRAIFKDQLEEWRSSISAVNGSSSESGLDAALEEASEYLADVRDFLNLCMDAVDKAVNVASATVTTYRTNVSTARANIITSMTTVSTLKQAIASQKQTNATNILTAEMKLNEANNAVSLAERQLALKQAGPTQKQIEAQEAQVVQYEASLQSARAQLEQAQAQVANAAALLEKTILRAPIDGVIARQEAKAGEMASANFMVASVISDKKYEIVANVTEMDISKLRIGQQAAITLDAYGSDIKFPATVIKIDPGETVLEGVATYKVTMQFSAEDERFKSGMTSNIDIKTDEREGVIYVPYRAVFARDDKKYVNIYRDNTAYETEVQTGMRASDGNIEIVSGVSEADVILMPDL